MNYRTRPLGPTGSRIGLHGVTNVTCECDACVRMLNLLVTDATNKLDDYHACN